MARHAVWDASFREYVPFDNLKIRILGSNLEPA